MPLLSTRQINDYTYLGFWQLSETPEMLEEQLNLIAPVRLAKPAITNKARQCQWLAGRLLTYLLLQKFTDAKLVLKINENGKPVFINSDYKFSISHTAKYVAVILSANCEVGIDIEPFSPKVLRVKHKFLSAPELEAAGESLEKTLIYWCTKETLYKIYGRNQVLFKDHLQVKPFVLQPKGKLDAAIITANYQKAFLVHYEILPDIILTYCVDLPEK